MWLVRTGVIQEQIVGSARDGEGEEREKGNE